MAEIRLEKGDISEASTEAVVNAANNRLYMGAGVAGALKRKGGQEIEDEAVRQGPIPIGEAIVTSAGRLKARYVIHAAVMGLDLRTDAVKILAATQNSLRRAEELGLKSIAFPALGTGVGGFPLEQCARIMRGAVNEHLGQREAAGQPSSLQEIVFVLYGDEAYQAFEKVWEAPP